MVQYIPPPDARSLLPPLLACLPTAFASPRPPPALLELLSPILSQRVQLLATTPSPSSSESWLPLLTWDAEAAKQLVDLVSESDAFELHPISGEIEVGSIETIQYRRLDEETLQARVASPDTGLTIIVLWCEANQEGGNSAWKIAEVFPLGGEDVKSGHWCLSRSEAEDQSRQRAFEEAVQDPPAQPSAVVNGSTKDDIDYWAQYDSAASETPGTGRTPIPGPSTDQNGHARTTSEAEYFQRYEQVQPEMDNDDPSAEKGAIAESTLDGNVVNACGELGQSMCHARSGGNPQRILSHPSAAPQMSWPATVANMEEQADASSESNPAVKHHVSTSIKSLFRLCQASGIQRSEFEDLIRTELETLSMLDADEA